MLVEKKLERSSNLKFLVVDPDESVPITLSFLEQQKKQQKYLKVNNGWNKYLSKRHCCY